MFEALVAQFHSLVGTLSQGNEMAAGLISIWILTTGTFLMRRVPKRIYYAVRRKLLISLTLNNSPGDGQADFYRFMKWWTKHQPEFFMIRNRRTKLTYSRSGQRTLGAPDGSSFFVWRGKVFWVRKKLLPSDGVDFQKESITITTFGIDPKSFETLLDDFSPRRESEYVYIHRPTTSNVSTAWEQTARILTRDDGQFIMNRRLDDFVTERMNWFRDNAEWYESRHLPRKLTILLSGEPGCGKSTLIRALATRYRWNIYSINLITDGRRLETLVSSACKRSGIIAIEDFDDLPSVDDRSSENRRDVKEGQVTLSTLLNVLDGVARLDNVIVVLTTNHPERIDPALLRPGRVDLQINVERLDSEAIHRYIKFYYRDQPYDESLEFAPMRICDLTERFMEHRFDVDAFINTLPVVIETQLQGHGVE